MRRFLRSLMLLLVLALISGCSSFSNSETSKVKSVEQPRLATGGNFTCAIDTSDYVNCWAVNEGLWTESVSQIARPRKVTGLQPVSTISVSAGTGCAVEIAGSVKCWGEDLRRKKSDSDFLPSRHSFFDQLIAHQIPDITEATSVSVNKEWACAVISTGRVQCWGLNPATNKIQLTPVEVPDLTDVVQIVSEDTRSCALLFDSTVKCWGYLIVNSATGPTFVTEDSPKEVKGLSGVRSLSLQSNTSCAVIQDGSVKCWGNLAPLGIGDESDYFEEPQAISSLSEVDSFIVGRLNSCAIYPATTEVKCLGDNKAFGLKVNYEPTSISKLAGLTFMSSSNGTSCGLVSAGNQHRGNVYCWGEKVVDCKIYFPNTPNAETQCAVQLLRPRKYFSVDS